MAELSFCHPVILSIAYGSAFVYHFYFYFFSKKMYFFIKMYYYEYITFFIERNDSFITETGTAIRLCQFYQEVSLLCVMCLTILHTQT